MAVMKNATYAALARSNQLEDLACRIDALACAADSAGMTYAAGLLMQAADNISAEAAWLWETRNAPEKIQGIVPCNMPHGKT